MDTQAPADPLQEPLFKALFEQSSEAILLAQADDSRITHANLRALELLGHEPATLLAMRLPELSPVRGRQQLEAHLKGVVAGTARTRFSGFLERRGGESFPCQLRLRRVHHGGRTLLLATFADLSERLRAMEDIELRNVAIANVASGVTIADARQPDLPLIYVNNGFQEITGYSAAEVLGRSCRFLQGDDRKQPELEVLRAALRVGQPCVVRLRNYKKDGTLFHNELHISPVRNDLGELTHFVGIQIDVTERVRTRESLERSEQRYRQALEKEQQLNEIRSRFISMVSHEFRTPMTGIQASAALLRRLGDKLEPAKRAQHLSNIETSLRRMNRLLDDVLFYSRAESDKLKVNRKSLELHSHMDRLMESLHHIHPGRVIRCECRVPSGTAYLLDEHLLDHILHNLIGNAVKYSADDAPVSCTVSETADCLVFGVSDQGIGIPSADRDRLFDAFHRAGNVGTRQGTGLGLTIAKRAAEMLGGGVSFESTENRGSTFTVTLPRTPAPPQP